MLDQPREDGASLRETLESVARQTGREPERLAKVEPIPVEFMWHYNLWVEISAGRSAGGGFGPTGLTWLDMDAYCRLHNMRLTSLDILLIRAIDAAWLRAYSEEKDRQDKARERKSSQGNARR